MTVLFAITAEEVLYGYGPLGVGAVALAVIGYKMFNIILADRDKAIKDRDQLLEDFFTKVLPAISRNTEVLDERQKLDRDLVEIIKSNITIMSDNTKAFDEVKYVLRHGGNNPRAGG